MKITVLTGGVGGAKFLLGVKAFLGQDPYGPGPDDAASAPDGRPGPAAGDAGPDITAVVNTGDDIRLHGLQVCPDLDSCMYTLSGVADTERGWGRKEETWTAAAELVAYRAEAPWFALGDKDIATHLVRTRMLDAGYPLSEVTAALVTRWRPGVRLLPATDDRVETHVVVTDPAAGPDADAREAPDVALHFQEWWTRYRASIPARAFLSVGAQQARPGPGVLDSITGADLVLVAPSNPVVSIDTILAIPGIRDAVAGTASPVVAVSPLIAGKPLRGHADACLAAIGVECTAQGVGRHYGSRTGGGLLDGFLVADGDHALVPGVRVGHAPLLMTDPQATAAMVAACLELAR